MNKKGFTLVEVLSVIVIISLIAGIGAFSYSKVLEDSKIRECKQKILFIEKQAIKYVSDNNADIVTLNDLVENGYLEEDDLINPKTKTNFNGTISATKTNGLIDTTYNGESCE